MLTPLLAAPLTSSNSRESKSLRSFFEERAVSRQDGDFNEDLNALVEALKDCALDLYSCLLLPLVRDPKDPFLLAALGTTVFSGNLIAQTALRKSQPVVTISDPGRKQYLPILLDDPVDEAGSENGDISDEVSILISSRGEAAAGELTFSGDSWTSRSEPTDISALGQEPPAQSNQGLKQRRRSSAGEELKLDEQKEQAKDGTHNRKAGDGKQKSGHGKKNKSKTDEEEQKKKKRKGKRKFKITDYMKRRGLAKTNLKPNNHFNSTNSLVSSVANSILGNSLEKSKGKQLKDDSYVEGAVEPGRPLENAPECGIPRPGSNNQQPWLGALFVVPLDSPEKADKFIVPVVIISARTRLDPDRPTIIVASGEMFGDKVFNTWSSSVSSEDLASLGIRAEVRFDLENSSSPVVLPVKSIIWQPGRKDFAAIEVDPSILLDSDKVIPVCLPSSSEKHTNLSQVGWDMKSSMLIAQHSFGNKIDNLGSPMTRTTEIKECEEGEAEKDIGATLCFSQAKSRSVGWGSLLLSSTSKRVALVGFTRRENSELSRQDRRSGSSIFCLLQWLAQLYGRTWSDYGFCDA